MLSEVKRSKILKLLDKLQSNSQEMIVMSTKLEIKYGHILNNSHSNLAI